jgi:hypothetical protein
MNLLSFFFFQKKMPQELSFNPPYFASLPYARRTPVASRESIASATRETSPLTAEIAETCASSKRHRNE